MLAIGRTAADAGAGHLPFTVISTSLGPQLAWRLAMSIPQLGGSRRGLQEHRVTLVDLVHWNHRFTLVTPTQIHLKFDRPVLSVRTNHVV